MNKRFFVYLVCSCLWVSACSRSVPIGKLQDDPRAYADRVVTIKGQVKESFSLVLMKYFVVKDDTGEIYVVTEKMLPKTGATVIIKGTVQETFSIGNSQHIVLMEVDDKK